MDAITLNLMPKVEPVSDAARATAASSSRADIASKIVAVAESTINTSSQAVREAASELSLRLGLKVELGQDEGTGRNIVRIFNQEGDRLLRQIPAETVLRMLDRLKSGVEEGILGLQV